MRLFRRGQRSIQGLIWDFRKHEPSWLCVVMLCVWADQQAGQSTEWSVPFSGLEPSDLLWFFKIILLLLSQWWIRARGPGIPAPLVLFRPNWCPKRRVKYNFFWQHPPPPPLILRSRSTATYLSVNVVQLNRTLCSREESGKRIK